MRHFDIVIIGSGVGLMVMEAALNKGLCCAIVEKSKFGGTCLTKGCIPSKMLAYPAEFIREAERSDRIGIKIPHLEIDWDIISKRMWAQIDFSKSIENRLQNISNLTVYKGSGTFCGPNSMVISCEGKADETIHGDKFVIAAGARTLIPTAEGLESTGYVTAESFFGAKFPKKLWKSLAIIGGGAISAEFAHIFSAFGTEVTIIARSEILNKEEKEVAQFVSRQFIKNDIKLLTNSTIVSVSADGGTKHIVIENSLTKKRTVVECEEIFVASGLQSNSDTLSFEKAGVAVDQHGWVITNPYMETSNEHVWALGDINGKYQFRHKANYEAQILIHNFFSDEDKKEARYDTVPWAIFTHPQVAHVGMTEKEAHDKGLVYQTAINHYAEVVGGIAMGYRNRDDDNGFVKIIVGEDKKILGVHIVGPQAAVLLQPFVYLMNVGYQCQKTKQDMNAKGLDELRILCPNIGTYEPINHSMVIHPSLNELTAWVFEKIHFPE